MAVKRLGNTTIYKNPAGSFADPSTFSHTVPTGTNAIFACLAVNSPNDIITSMTWNGTDSFAYVQGVSQSSLGLWVCFPTSTNTTANINIDWNNAQAFDSAAVTILNFSGVEDRNGATGAATIIDVATTSAFEMEAKVVDGATNDVFAGEYQVAFGFYGMENSQTPASDNFTNNLGWAEIADDQSGTGLQDIWFWVYDTDSFTDDDVQLVISESLTGSLPVAGKRYRIEELIYAASGTASTPTPFSTSTTKRPPRVYLNTTQTKAGATELAVQSFNDAGTSLTFNDPTGAPTGSLFLGIENTSTRFIDWQAVTVNTGPIGSGTPSITPIEAAGNALRTTVTVTDVANSGETPGAGSETWNDGSSGNVITGSGFV